MNESVAEIATSSDRLWRTSNIRFRSWKNKQQESAYYEEIYLNNNS